MGPGEKLTRELSRRPCELSSILRLVRECLREGEAEEALEALRGQPPTPASRAALGDCQLELGDWRGARESYGEALRLSGGEGASPIQLKLTHLGFEEKHLWSHIERALEDTSNLNAVGCAHLLRGRLAEAAEAFKRAFKANPADVQAALNLGLAVTVLPEEMRDLRSSLSVIKTAARRKSHARFYLHQAELYEGSSLIDAAAERLAKALGVDPCFLEAYDAASRLGLLDPELVERFERVRQEAESRARAEGDRERLALLLVAGTRLGSVPEGAREALKLEGLSPLARGEALRALGAAKEAWKEFVSAPRTPETISKAAGCLMRSGELEGAIEALSEGLRSFPEEAVLAHALSYAITGLRRLKWAEAEAEALGDLPEACFLLGRAYFNASMYEKAVEFLREAAGREPSNAAYRALYARALLRLGKPGEAEAEARAALELDSDSRDAGTVLTEIELDRLEQ